MNISEFRKEIEGGDESLIAGVNRLKPEVETLEKARVYIQVLCQNLLDLDRYGAAAELLWGPLVFNPRPNSVKRIWSALQTYDKLILLGASAMGKSYCAIVWLLLDWLRDVSGTSAKVISTSESHARANTFSILTHLYRTAIIPLPGIQIDRFIGLDSKELDKGIGLVSIPQGDTGKGRLRGFHPKPRETAHPTLGAMTRVRVMCDESEECPEGIWDGIDNLLASMDDAGSVKIICATNPKDPLSRLAELAEPIGGWPEMDIDTEVEWDSRERWRVVRLDAARSENVVERREVFPGLMTYGGYENLRLKNDGNSPEYYTFARGIYPRIGSIRSLIPLSILDNARGNFVFTRTSTNCGSSDLAFEGGDDVAFAVGRYGLAEGWRPMNKTKIIPFDKPVYCCELEAIYTLPNLLTLAQIRQLRTECMRLDIPPLWYTIDRTGNATGTHDGLVESWSPEVRGINWSEGPTRTKILEADKELAEDLYTDLPTEMWFALRRWLEFGFFLVSPHVETKRLFGELTKRRYSLGSKGPNGLGRMKIESKREFKLGNRGISPDFADCCVMLLHGCRLNSRERLPMPGLVKARDPRPLPKDPPSPWSGRPISIATD